MSAILIFYLIVSYIIGMILWLIIGFLDKVSGGVFIFGKARSAFNWFMLVFFILSPIILLILIIFLLLECLKSHK